ncbi:DUF4181 domain-containing protein [Bacillus suaedaesalsae]|uniref:DUF4181 domain-containing protein n=1 Tax=Bacillus suaedaesalsae TaxID=2810349 RepID=A0ABS2DER6_9BACI|nr:DUF4181 domain-containing protein [Bacillus suaedaesalsae]MBM6616947.1 DUF4181 domain-containing protein [Bacillus suaedaesalsae]
MKLLIIILVYLLLDSILCKLLKVKRKSIFGRYEHLDVKYASTEKYLFYACLGFMVINLFFDIVNSPFTIMWLFFSILWLYRGYQEWKFNKENKVYVLSWFSSIVFGAIAFLTLVGIT